MCSVCITELLKAWDWLVVNTLEQTYQRTRHLLTEGQSHFNVRNNSQTFYGKTLATVFGEVCFGDRTDNYGMLLLNDLVRPLSFQRMIFAAFCTFLDTMEDGAEKLFLTQLAALYGTTALLKHLPILLTGKFFVVPSGSTNSDPLQLMQQAILQLLPIIKRDAVAMMDALAPPDFILNSPLGAADGEFYKRLESEVMQEPGVTGRPSWWADILCEPKANL